MRDRDQWVHIQAVIDHLGQEPYPIIESMMDLEWPQDAWNYGECWSAYPVLKLIEDSITADPGRGYFLPIGWLC
jgi:hypothetical protein